MCSGITCQRFDQGTSGGLDIIEVCVVDSSQVCLKFVHVRILVLIYLKYSYFTHFGTP